MAQRPNSLAGRDQTPKEGVGDGPCATAVPDRAANHGYSRAAKARELPAGTAAELAG